MKTVDVKKQQNIVGGAKRSGFKPSCSRRVSGK